jgi:hypothetical protein
MMTMVHFVDFIINSLISPLSCCQEECRIGSLLISLIDFYANRQVQRDVRGWQFWFYFSEILRFYGDV